MERKRKMVLPGGDLWPGISAAASVDGTGVLVMVGGGSWCQHRLTPDEADAVARALRRLAKAARAEAAA